ncbi:hypothetical protein KSP39_PZI011858 [Platanthera zijinensis]|uniref:ethanolamine-phosphate cytidylyltransferase n=1 Tax=Platanthera zijinensis TaxID=2320716 RepID=A0AAP0G536_9ASPA
MDPATGLMDFENNNRIWYGVPKLVGLGGIMITAAIVGLSKGYFGGIGAHAFPFLWPDLGIYRWKSSKRPVRVYMDGCFDLMHYGHANALRQAKALGDVLVVGVVSDEEIVANKGPPVLSMEERLILVSGLKWVDEVITNAPYEITEQFMNTLFNEYQIDYIIHGDDPCLLPDGTDAYAVAKKVGRYKQIKRTEGVSSTDIVGRILSTLRCTEVDGQANIADSELCHNEGKPGSAGTGCMETLSHFLPTSRRIMQFSNAKGPGPDARVVYIDGTFDLFHAGHVEIFRYARQFGDFLLVGIHSDQIVSHRRGSNPIMHLHERSLSVLACRYVDEVIIGAPWEVTTDMIRTFNISLVVHGTVSESGSSSEEMDPYSIPKAMGIFKTIVSPQNITSSSIASRIIHNLEAYKRRNLNKKKSENRYYEEKKFVSGD